MVAVLSASAPSFAEDQLSEAGKRWVEEELARDSNGDARLGRDEVRGTVIDMGWAAIDADEDGFVTAVELREFASSRLLAEHRWVNPIPAGTDLPPGVKHATFISPSMKHEVGYVIYLPPGYEDSQSASRRYPVVYFLHGGNPGNELKRIDLTHHLHRAMTSGEVPPAIYVYVNGGEVSHFNWPAGESMGEDVFVHELIPHVDATYRTIAARRGRAIEGFSAGGRGTARIMFKYPEFFVSAAPGGPGFQRERQLLENGGVQYNTLHPFPTRYDFGEGNDAFSLARAYAKNREPPLKIAFWVGTKDFNYESTLEYMGFLYGLEIPFERFVVPEAEHNTAQLYRSIGVELMNFHARNSE